MTPTRMLDVLIVTSLRTEHDAVLAVETGAVAGRSWEARTGPGGLKLSVRPYLSHDGGELKVGLTFMPEMGVEGAAAVSKALLSELRAAPRCIVVCGICAGRSGAVNVGDVIFADRVRVKDTTSWSLDLRWAWFSAQFTVPLDAPWLQSRPLPLEAQAHWVLVRLADGADPTSDPGRPARCPDWTSVLLHLRAQGLLAPKGLALTDAGRVEASELRLLHPDGLPEAPGWQLHCGPIEMITRVTDGAQLAAPGTRARRAALGVELDSSVIAALPGLAEVTRCLVVRGVSERGDAPGDERARSFAARAAAECALLFVRDRLGAATLDDVVDPGTAALPESFPPSALLEAKYSVAPFHGRAETLAALRSWCAEGDVVQTRLVYADGGMGKTRLAIELCVRLRREGWVAGFLREPAPKRWFEDLWESERPVLVVIDDAERCAALPALLEPVARNRAGWKRAPFRVLLLARRAGDGWTQLAERGRPLQELLREQSPEALLPLVPSVAEREDVVRAAAAAFAEVLRRPLPSGELSPLVDGRFEHVLYLHMAALAWVHEIPFTAETLREEILDLEERDWRTRVDALGEPPAEVPLVEKVRRAVTGLTLSGGALSEERARALLGRVNDGLDEGLLTLLRALYTDRPRFLRGLEPELLGDSLVGRTLGLLSGERGEAVEAFLDRVFEGADERALVTGFEVLGRLSAVQPEKIRPWIAHLLARDLPGRALLALEASKAISAHTAHAVLGMELAAALEREGTVALAERLEAAGIPDDAVSMLEVGAWVTTRLLSLHPSKAEGVEAPGERARLLLRLGTMQRALGRREAALSSTVEAAEITRDLAAARPDTFLPDLANSLNNLGNAQSALGQWEDALASTREAVDIRRTLALAQPDAFLPALATSLNNLGNMQSELGQWETALASTREAVDLYRTLIQTGPDAFLPDLAMSLNNLSTMQSALGQREPALASASEAVDIRRTLAQTRPDAFLPALATSLNNLGTMQFDLGQRDDALVSAREAVDLYRTLTLARPDAFLPALAASLNNLGIRQRELEQREDALTSTREAVDLYRTLTLARLDAFLPDLARSLNNLGTVQIALGKRKDALTSTREAVDLYRTLTLARPDAFLPELAMSLNNLGGMQNALGKREDALASTREAVDLYRTLTLARPDAFLPDLARSLSNLALMLHDLGRSHEALPFAQEALDLLWPFYECFPEAHGKLAGAVLRTMADLLKALGQAPNKAWHRRMTRYLAISGS